MLYAASRLVAAIWLAAFSATAGVMFGALLTRVPDPYSLMAAFHLLYLAMVVWAAASGIVGLLAGIALTTGRRAAAGLVRLSAYLCVGDVPLGTTLAVYTLTVLPPPVLAETSLHAKAA